MACIFLQSLLPLSTAKKRALRRLKLIAFRQAQVDVASFPVILTCEARACGEGDGRKPLSCDTRPEKKELPPLTEENYAYWRKRGFYVSRDAEGKNPSPRLLVMVTRLSRTLW